MPNNYPLNGSFQSSLADQFYSKIPIEYENNKAQ